MKSTLFIGTYPLKRKYNSEKKATNHQKTDISRLIFYNYAYAAVSSQFVTLLKAQIPLR